MTNFTIYHNPRCSKSRQTLALLEERGISPAIKLYLETAPTTDELADILQKLGKTKGEEIYKSLGLKSKSPTEAEWLQLMTDNPKLIERPIVVKGDQAVLGRPPENVLELI